VDVPGVVGVVDVVDGVGYEGDVFFCFYAFVEFVEAAEGEDGEGLGDVLYELSALVGGEVADGGAVAFEAVEEEVAVVVPADDGLLVL
jgi:hypothetical protein